MLSKITSKIKLFYQNLLDSIPSLSDLYPINFSNLTKFRLVGSALFKSSPRIKFFLGLFVAGLISSFIFLGSGLYLFATEDTPSVGGTVNEVVLNGSIQRLNPVLEATSEAEQKINALLFHPLYYVNYPDYLTSSTEPTIEPVLLEKAPEWQNDSANPENNYKILKFTLKKAKWCDNTNITVDDIIYSFNRLKEEGGNANFNALLQDYEIQPVIGNNSQFIVQPNRTDVPGNSQLIYALNFQPISKTFYQGAKNPELKSSFRSLQPANSSGFYCLPTKMNNPDGSGQVDNPYRKDLEDYSQVSLKRNPNSNYKKDVYVETYNFRFIKTTGAQASSDSLDKLIKDKKVDLFTRFVTPPATNVSAISKFEDLKTKVVPTNTFFNLYLNLQASNNSYDGYLINQTLRNYLICNFMDFQLPRSLSEVVDPVPVDQRLIPIQFGEKASLDCSNADQKLTDLKNTRGAGIYTIDNDTRSNVKQVNVFNSPITLNLLFLDEFAQFAVPIQNQLKAMGLPVNTIVATNADLATKIAEKQYHLAFLPVNIQGKNPYSLFGKNGKNISSITNNDRVAGSEIEDALKTYSQSNLSDATSKAKLVDFFKNQFVSLNLFRGKEEINYSTRVKNLESGLPGSFVMVGDVYRSVPYWYLETARKWRF
jgi:hypothetical protein